MTSLTTKQKLPSLNTRKGRQILLENKIKEIDNRLNELGVADLKFKITSSVVNPESNQNSINITTSSDLNALFRMLASYKNMLSTYKQFCKEVKVYINPLTNVQGFSVSDIVSDLELKIKYLANIGEINKLNQIKDELIPFLNEETKFINALKKVEGILKS